MNTKIQRWGNSLAVRIPKHIAEAVSLDAGAQVHVEERDGIITITPASPKVIYDLDALLDGITPENTHAPVSTGRPIGREEL